MTTIHNRLADVGIGTSAIFVGFGALAIVLAAQVSIPLPGTPVPITLQSLAVVLVGFALGFRRGIAAVGAYLAAGALGAPVFAGFNTLPALWGPTSGYLVGFIPAVAIAGFAADRKWSGLVGTFSVAFVAQAVIIALGAAVLAAFVGTHQVWTMGVSWFLVGDVVKSTIATAIMAIGAQKK